MIRLAVATDAETIANIEKSVFDNPYTIETINNDITESRVHVMVMDDIVVGYIICSNVADEAEIQRVAITPAYRRMGLATILIAYIVNIMPEYGVNKVFLEARVDNEPAINLYTKCGFVELSRRKKYYRDGMDAIIFVKNL